jgi:hypothetical protein
MREREIPYVRVLPRHQVFNLLRHINLLNGRNCSFQRLQSDPLASSNWISRSPKLIFVKDHRAGLHKNHRAGRFRISVRACNRVESAALFVITALFSNEDARLLSFASSLCLMCELSAL